MAVEWLEAFNSGITLLRGALGLIRDVREELPPDKRKAVDQALEQADKATSIAEAQIAKALGYQLCQCTFPPQIMLFVGYDDHATYREEAAVHQCPRCRNESLPIAVRRRSRPDFGVEYG
jgi:hypothetical protein